MIRVIRPGNIKKPVVIFECARCDAVFEADSDDYKESSTYYDDFWKAICPCCGATVYKDK